jgi:hypothetical protein
MTPRGHEGPAFAAMHGPDLLYLKSLALGKAHEAAGVHRTSRQWCGDVATRGAGAAADTASAKLARSSGEALAWGPTRYLTCCER